MKKTFEDFKKAVEDAVSYMNSQHHTIEYGKFYVEWMAKIVTDEKKEQHTATLYYRWVDVNTNEPAEKFHRNKGYYAILYTWANFATNTFSIWHNGDTVKAGKNLKVLLKNTIW